jgi:unsaturated chondroitin disaccharide hydrolase
MKGKSFAAAIISMFILGIGGKAQQVQKLKAKSNLVAKIDNSIQKADKQYKYFMQQIPADKFPRSLDRNGKLVTSNSEWWCSGFYPGTLLYLVEATKDAVLKDEALKKLKLLEKEQFNKSTHDLGFMMFCSFGNANRLEPKPEYKEILINSARSLASRFDEKVGCIRSWNSKPSDFLVIIDNMMNLELLFWATKETGDSSFYKIAVIHANTTLKNHFRPDYSSYHQVNYNAQTGMPQKKRTVQGAADASAWSRGQAWGLYGYTVMYRETKDKKYLEMANHIADYTLNHPNLPADKIPYWDFNAPGIPNALRDASAGAVNASALIELAGYNERKTSKAYLKAAEAMLNALCSDAYTVPYGKSQGFLLEHSVGNLPGKSEVDAPLTYADYYFVEAMLRYKQLNNKP